MSNRPSPQHHRRNHRLTPEQTKVVQRHVRVYGWSPAAKAIGCSVLLLQELASEGTATRATIERIGPAVDALRGAL